MSPAEYQMTMDLIAGAYRTLSMLPLVEIVRASNHADAIGPMLDPTLYRDKSKAMHEDRKILQAALTFVNEIGTLLK